MKRRIECTVTGRVQFVTFRYFTFLKARKLGVVGTVENQEDGSVRVIAEGEDEKLQKLIYYLSKGPIFAKVQGVRVEDTPPQGQFTDFQIIY